MKDHHPAEAPVAWAIELEDGTIGGFGWASMDTFATVQAIATLREGTRYVFAYREASPEAAALRAEVERLDSALSSAMNQLAEADTVLARVEVLADEWSRNCANPVTETLAAELRAALEGSNRGVADAELPDMWSSSDLIGGDPDERSHAERKLAEEAALFRWLRDKRRGAIPEYEGGWDVIEYVDGGEREYCSSAMTLEGAIAKDMAADRAAAPRFQEEGK